MTEHRVEEREGVGTDDRNGEVETSGEASWILGKSQMLDEMNQLVELMTAEKSALEEKFLALESDVDQHCRQTEELRQSVDRKNKILLRLKSERSFLKEKRSKQQTALHATLHKTKEELRSVRKQLEAVEQSFEEEKKCHTEAKAKLNTCEKKRVKLAKELHQQRAENEKMKEQLTTAKEQLNESQSRQEELQSQLKTSKQKTRDEILALRGKLTRNQRTRDQLKAHCTLLEKEVETRVHQVSLVKAGRTKEETRLAKECRKKDELLATYLHEIATFHERQQTTQKEIRKLQTKLSKSEEEKKELNTRLEENMQKYCRLQQQMKKAEDTIRTRRQQDEKAEEQCSELAERVKSLTIKLESSQREETRLRAEVHRQREREREMERRHDKLLELKQSEVGRLRTQLEEAWATHQGSMEITERQWSQRLRDVRSDYERLKTASTKRCVELAKEVWELKSSLESTRNL